MRGIILLAGHSRSLASLLLASALCSRDHSGLPLRAVFCLRTLSFRRIRNWYRQYRTDLGAKILSGLGFRTNGPLDEERQTFLERWREQRVGFRNLNSLCRARGVAFHRLTSFHSPACLDLLERYRPQYAVYSGGGILRESFLQAVKGGVLNLHCGPLPHVRGMNAVEWSLFLGLRPTVTLHYIDRGIDTGPILASRTLSVARGEPLGRIRARTVLAGIDLLDEHWDALSEGQCPTTPNPSGQGRQYYAMADSLKARIQTWINRGITPVLSAAEVSPEDLRPASQRLVMEGCRP